MSDDLWVEKDWVDGPGLFAWLQERRGRPDHVDSLARVRHDVGPTLTRRLWGWQHGATAHWVAVDKLLSALDLHLQDLPDELWCEDPRSLNGKGRREEIPASKILDLHATGKSTREIATECRCSIDLVRVRLKDAGVW